MKNLNFKEVIIRANQLSMTFTQYQEQGLAEVEQLVRLAQAIRRLNLGEIAEAIGNKINNQAAEQMAARATWEGPADTTITVKVVKEVEAHKLAIIKLKWHKWAQQTAWMVIHRVTLIHWVRTIKWAPQRKTREVDLKGFQIEADSKEIISNNSRWWAGWALPKGSMRWQQANNRVHRISLSSQLQWASVKNESKMPKIKASIEQSRQVLVRAWAQVLQQVQISQVGQTHRAILIMRVKQSNK